MRALCWHGKGDVRVDTVPDPKIQHPRDAVIKITACAICHPMPNGAEGDGALAIGAVRLLAHVGGLPGRPGGVSFACRSPMWARSRLIPH